MEITVTSAPATEPITATEAKLFCRVDGSADDNLFTILIAAARRAVEMHTGRALITQTRKVTWHYHEAQAPLYIPSPPLLTTTSIKTYDETRTSTTLVSGTDYYVVGTDPAIITGATQTAAYFGGIGVRSVEWIGTCGYGAASDVPQDIKQAMLILIADAYEKRETAVVLTNGVRELLAPYRANLV